MNDDICPGGREGDPDQPAGPLARAYLEKIGSCTNRELADIGRSMWVDHADGRLSLPEMQPLIAAIEARKARAKGPSRYRGALGDLAKRLLPSVPPARASPRPRPTRSIEEEDVSRLDRLRARREVTRKSSIPAEISRDFTPGEQAVLGQVVYHQLFKGPCEWAVQILADRARVCKRVAQSALAKAHALGLLGILRRRRATSVITVISIPWLEWARKLRRAQPDREKIFQESQESRDPSKGADSCNPTIPDQAVLPLATPEPSRPRPPAPTLARKTFDTVIDGLVARVEAAAVGREGRGGEGTSIAPEPWMGPVARRFLRDWVAHVAVTPRGAPRLFEGGALRPAVRAWLTSRFGSVGAAWDLYCVKAPGDPMDLARHLVGFRDPEHGAAFKVYCAEPPMSG